MEIEGKADLFPLQHRKEHLGLFLVEEPLLQNRFRSHHFRKQLLILGQCADHSQDQRHIRAPGGAK